MKSFCKATRRDGDKSTFSFGHPNEEEAKMDFQSTNNRVGFKCTGTCPATVKTLDQPCTRCLSFFRGLVHALVLSGFFWWMMILFLAKILD